jgi:hypothetical protein
MFGYVTAYKPEMKMKDFINIRHTTVDCVMCWKNDMDSEVRLHSHMI